MRKQAWRLDPNAYPFRWQLQTRYADLDTWRHVNNVAVQQLHLEARLRHQMDVLGEDAWYSDGVRLRPRRMETHFLRVMEYPAPVEAGVRVVAVGETGYRLAVGLFQQGRCAGAQDCLVGGWTREGPAGVTGSVLEAMAARCQPVDELSPIAEGDHSAPDVAGYPLHHQLSARYGDLDADSGVSELSVARFMEQGRSSLVRRLDLAGRGLVVASVDLCHGSYRPIGGAVDLYAGVCRVGRSSFVIRTVALRRDRLLGAADSVMVLTDLDADKPSAMDATFRDALLAYCLPAGESA